MDRKETTEFLTEVLIANKLTDRKYYAKEVSVDYGTDRVKRVDVMQFVPQGVVYGSDIEKGKFICYEIKSCKRDVFSGHGLNFLGEENYIVTTMQTYKDIQEHLRNLELDKYIRENYPESSTHFGILVPVPAKIDLRNVKATYEEYENPTELGGKPSDWKLQTVVPCRNGRRSRSMIELLFCMLRSKHNYSNHK